jgi:hypothetical protein
MDVDGNYLGRWYAKDSTRYYVNVGKKVSSQKYKLYILEADTKRNKIVYDSFFLAGEEIKQTKVNQVGKFTEFILEMDQGHLVRTL